MFKGIMSGLWDLDFWEEAGYLTGRILFFFSLSSCPTNSQKGTTPTIAQQVHKQTDRGKKGGRQTDKQTKEILIYKTKV